MARRKVEVIKGHGAFTRPDTVRVGDRTLYAGHIVIAKALEADWVVNGAGRIADANVLGLAAGQVDHNNGRIAIDSYLRSTSNSRV